MNFKNNI